MLRRRTARTSTATRSLVPLNNPAVHMFKTEYLAAPQEQREATLLNVMSRKVDLEMQQVVPVALLACSFFVAPTFFLRSPAVRSRVASSPWFLGLAAVSATQTASSPLRTESEPQFSNASNNIGARLEQQDILHAPMEQALKKIRYKTKSILRNAPVLPQLQSSGDETKATLTLIGYKGGDLEEQINQDCALLISPYLVSSYEHDLEAYRLLGIFDGHALYGERVSQFCAQELPKQLALKFSQRLDSDQSEDEQERIIVACLEETFVELDRSAPYGEQGGCTATVMLQMGRKIYIANAGDSRSFICMHSRGHTQVVYISREDKPDLPEERARVERMGGKVWVPTGPGAARVLFTDPATGDQTGIAMSRSIGDRDIGRYGVIPDPIVEVVDLQVLIDDRLEELRAKKRGSFMSFSSDPEDVVDDIHIFAVAASDGMMDILNPNGIARFLVPSMCEPHGQHLLTACEQLISTAADGWQRASDDGRYRDDIAISVTKIRTPPNSK